MSYQNGYTSGYNDGIHGRKFCLTQTRSVFSQAIATRIKQDELDEWEAGYRNGYQDGQRDATKGEKT